MKKKNIPSLTVRELIEKLQQCDPDALVISTIWNGCTDTYCALDNVQEFTYDELTQDFFGTPGEMDKRVTASTTKNVVCVTSIFEHNDNVLRDKFKNVQASIS